jgi:hypothetical protein
MLLFGIAVPGEQKHPDHSKGLVSLCILALYAPKRASTWSPSGCSHRISRPPYPGRLS